MKNFLSCSIRPILPPHLHDSPQRWKAERNSFVVAKMTGHSRLKTVLGGTLAPDDNPFRMAGHVHGTSPRKIECTCIYEVSALTDSYIALFIVFCCTEYVTRWVCFQLSLFILFYFSTSVITSPSLPLFETLALLKLLIPFSTSESASFMVFFCCRIVHVADLFMPYWMANWGTSRALSYLQYNFLQFNHRC